jgi:tRNA-dihydrouridine synthase B
MKIGNIDFGHRPLFLAPMEDVTDIGFRKLCKRYGASMVYTEFVSADAIIRNIKSTLDKMKIDDEERPVGIQIYGRDVESMVEAAKMVESVHPDVIDLNFGCPVKKVAGKGAGAGMLRNIPLLLDITREVVKAVHTPVTVKTRLGWDQNNLIITDLAERLQDCGIQALTIHGRTRSQMYTGNADWTLIGEVKRNPRIHIPIIGNGDIATPEQALHAFEEYGVDAVMIGRATFGQPWIFREMRHAIDTEACDGLKTEVKAQQETAERQQGQDAFAKAGQPSEQGTEGLQGKEEEYRPLTLDEKIDILEEQLRINIARIDEKRGILHTRRHLAASPIFKGIPDFRQTRIAMLRAETEEELVGILEKCRELLRPYQGTQEP